MRALLRSARVLVFTHCALYWISLQTVTAHTQVAATASANALQGSVEKAPVNKVADGSDSRPAYAAVQSNTIDPVKSTIEVRAEDIANQNISPAREAYRDEIQSAAGSYGDYSRYLMILPGVITTGNSDSMNDILVRGGHPSENLYVVDGLEVPYINHFTMEGTPSGFSPMINTSSVSKVELQPGYYDAQYSSRLSSLIEIQTRDQSESGRSGEINVGISGLGGFVENPLGERGNAFLAMDRSLFNLVTSNFGLDGVPVYTDGMARLQWSPDEKDQLSLLNISGGDSISIAPCAADLWETLTTDTQYGGLRTTNGFVWMHTHGPATVSKFTLSYAAQGLDIDQQDQYANGSYTRTGHDCTAPKTTPLYAENTLDQLTTLGYNLRHDLHSWLFSVGADGQMVNLNYTVSQAAGQQSPYNPDPAWTDSNSFHRNPLSTQTGSFVEMTGPFGQRWTASAGLRVETFGLPHANTWEPHAGLGFRISKYQAIHAAYRRSAQLPPYMDLLSYPQNLSLQPERAEQFSTGADLWRTSMATLSLEAYRKRYWDEPVSTEYPSLMLANMVYIPGEQVVWLPLETAGKGRASGLELLLRGHWSNHLSVMTSVTYSRVQYAALDGVYRAGNYDVPLVGNVLLTFHLPHAVNFSMRDSYSEGRPYTPFNVPLSVQQHRGIYDLTRVNALRGPAYNRADISADHNFHMPSGMLNLYVGVQNIFDRQNFLGYIWLPRCSQSPSCVKYMHGSPIQEAYQMSALPVAGMRWDF